MPSARVRTITAVNSGLRAKERIAYLKSRMTSPTMTMLCLRVRARQFTSPRRRSAVLLCSWPHPNDNPRQLAERAVALKELDMKGAVLTLVLAAFLVINGR